MFLIPVTVRSCLIAGVAGVNPAEGKDVLLLFGSVGTGLCGELITHSEESYRVRAYECVCLIVCDL